MLVLNCHYEKLYLLVTETAHLKQQEYTHIIACMCIHLSEFCTYPIGHRRSDIVTEGCTIYLGFTVQSCYDK